MTEITKPVSLTLTAEQAQHLYTILYFYADILHTYCNESLEMYSLMDKLNDILARFPDGSVITLGECWRHIDIMHDHVDICRKPLKKDQLRV